MFTIKSKLNKGSIGNIICVWVSKNNNGISNGLSLKFKEWNKNQMLKHSGNKMINEMKFFCNDIKLPKSLALWKICSWEFVIKEFDFRVLPLIQNPIPIQ